MSQPTGRPKIKLLLIVDNWELLERYEERFSPHYEVLAAPLGEEGLRMAREDQPDLILLNLAFENMTASEACTALRTDPLTSAIPIVAVGEVEEPGPDFWMQPPPSLEGLNRWVETLSLPHAPKATS